MTSTLLDQPSNDVPWKNPSTYPNNFPCFGLFTFLSMTQYPGNFSGSVHVPFTCDKHKKHERRTFIWLESIRNISLTTYPYLLISYLPIFRLVIEWLVHTAITTYKIRLTESCCPALVIWNVQIIQLTSCSRIEFNKYRIHNIFNEILHYQIRPDSNKHQSYFKYQSKLETP